MLIFNGKKYFVPFIATNKVDGADAKPDQVVEGAKFVGAKGVLEDGTMPIVDVASPIMTVQNDEGELMIEACNDQDEGYVRGTPRYESAHVALTSDRDEVVATCIIETSGQTISIKKSVGKGALPPPVLVFNQQTGVLQAIVSFEEGGTMGYIDYTSATRGTYDVSQHIDPSIIKGGETLFGKEGTMPDNGAKQLFLGRADENDNWISSQYITEGYHNGDGVAFINPQTPPPVTPNHDTQIIKPPVGYVLKQVTVNPIPSNYKDATGADALPRQVVQGVKFLGANGVVEEGEIPKFGDETIRLSLSNTSVSLTPGYHSDTLVEILTEKEQEITPTKSGVTVLPRNGYVLSTVKVNGDNNLTQENIADGVSIFGILGTHKGGVSIETCTLNIKWSITPSYPFITATTFANGAISVFVSRTSSGTVTIPNVVCGSVVTVYTGSMTSVYGWSYGTQINGNAYAHALTIPASTGNYTAEIGVIDD